MYLQRARTRMCTLLLLHLIALTAQYFSNWIVEAQQCARLMDANNQIAHVVRMWWQISLLLLLLFYLYFSEHPLPASSWTCYANLPLGVATGTKSNLAAGPSTMRDNVLLWIQDSPSQLGHRFWLTHPLLPYATFGNERKFSWMGTDFSFPFFLL